MSDTTSLARLEALVARLEALAPPPDDLAPGVTAIPPYVTAGELIESAWGNDVVDTLIELSTRRGNSAAGSTSIAAGGTQQLGWQNLTNPDWGAGPTFIAPSYAKGLYHLSLRVEGPGIAQTLYAGVWLNVVNAVGSPTFANSINPGMQETSVSGLVTMNPGAQLGVVVFNPTAAAAFFDAFLTWYEVSP